MPGCSEQSSTFDPHSDEYQKRQLTEFEMRAFIVLALAALVSADVGGYNYGAGPSGGGASLSGPIGDASLSGPTGSASLSGPIGAASLSGPTGSASLSGPTGSASLSGPIGAASLSGPTGSASLSGSIGSASLSGPIGAASLSGPISGSVADLGHESVQPHDAGPVEVEKEFFTFSAPEADFDDGHGLNDVAASVKKNLRVIFIKGPENDGLSQAALNLARSVGDSKTAIYILQKQSDVSGLAQQLQNINQQNKNKPEVHFVKYRTPEDAAHAQQAIQQQYNELGGSSQSHDGGVAPVLNFASKAPAAVAPSGAVGGGSNYGQAPANVYIPPASAAQSPSATYLPIVKF